MKKLFFCNIILLLFFQNYCWSQYLALDQSFGNNGSMSFSSNYNSFFTKLLIDPAGKLIFSYGSNKIVKLNSDGTLDASFGTNGILTTPIIPQNGDNIEMFLISEKIICFYQIGSNYKLVCLNPNGTYDLSFGTSGEVLFNASIKRTIEKDDLNNIYLLSYAVASQTITKFFQNGTIDNSFGINGILPLSLNIPSNNLLNIEKVTSNEFFIHRLDLSSNYINDHIYKVTQLGALDTTFGVNGELFLNTSNGKSFTIKFLSSGDFFITRTPSIEKYNSNGQIDLSFGVNGSKALNGHNYYSKPEIYNDKIYCTQLNSFIGAGGGTTYGRIQSLNLNDNDPATTISLGEPSNNRYPTDIEFVEDKVLVYGYRNYPPTNFVSRYSLTSLSVEKNEIDIEISIQNPVIDEIKISSSQIINSITLYGLDGKLLKTSIGSNMDVLDIIKGVYIAKLNFRNGQIITKKIIII